MNRSIPFLLILVLASCERPHFADQASAENDIRETVFRYQFGPPKSGGHGAYYLDFSGKHTDPPDDFMRRFAGHSPAVKKVSQCKMGNLAEGVRDLETNEPGVIFGITSIKWISDTKVEVSGEWVSGGLSGSGHTYTVRWRQGKWQVTKDSSTWDS